ncbi:sulfite exporter TauE/SafE family protein [Catenovulum sediminis]|uniref:Probable membrane transporter protein n=1 Tax=Catenovulum sediminis TaxID=1740262 RepID=A0ABV1RFQ4_9ALTE|nr:sulfite exporter TauE/SafE family protein [Catenovulum sediminis]
MLEILIGAVIGLVLGLTGAGGSIFAVPLLILLLDIPVQQAIGVSLATVAFSSLFGVLIRFTQRQIIWIPAVIFALLGAIFAPLGNWLNHQLPTSFIIIGFVMLTVLIAYKMWQSAPVSTLKNNDVRAKFSIENKSSDLPCQSKQSKQAQGQAFSISAKSTLGLSLAAATTGIMSGLFGVGGGFLIVPSLLLLTRMKFSAAIATSLFVIAVISSSGFISFAQNSAYMDWSLILLISLGGITGMLLGFFLSRHLTTAKLQQSFSVAMCIMALVMLIKHFGG